MTSLHFFVPVAAAPHEVHQQFTEASSDPARFVRMFTTSSDVTAEVRSDTSDLWQIKVEGAQFKSSGTATIHPAQHQGSRIEIKIDLRGKGLMGLASPLLSLASGRIEGEATEALQGEFGLPTEPRSGPR